MERDLLTGTASIQIMSYANLMSTSTPATASCRCYYDQYSKKNMCQVQTWTGYPSSLMYCDATKCEFDGQPAVAFCKSKKLAILPTVSGDADLDRTVEEFKEFLNALDPLTAGFVTTQFKSQDDLEEYLAENLYSTSEDIDNIGAAIVWNKGYPDFDFTIRVNDTLYGELYAGDMIPLPSTSSMFNTEKSLSAVTQDGQCLNLGCPAIYAISDFLTYQQAALDYSVNALLDKTGAVSAEARTYKSNFVAANMRHFPSPSYNSSGFWGIVGGIFAPFLTIAFMFSVANMVRELVIEKETKIREGMKMMSLGTGALVSSWVLHFVIPLYIVGVVVCILAKGLFMFSDPSVSRGKTHPPHTHNTHTS